MKYLFVLQLVDEFLSNPNPPQVDEEKPIFTLEKVEYKPNGLKYMAVNNNILVMALNLPRIFSVLFIEY
jgi:hypothetical protein